MKTISKYNYKSNNTTSFGFLYYTNAIGRNDGLEIISEVIDKENRVSREIHYEEVSDFVYRIYELYPRSINFNDYI